MEHKYVRNMNIYNSQLWTLDPFHVTWISRGVLAWCHPMMSTSGNAKNSSIFPTEQPMSSAGTELSGRILLAPVA